MSESFHQAAETLPKPVYERMKQSLELGHWPDGRKLSAEQKSLCMEAIILYEQANDVPEAQRVGYLDRDRCSSASAPADRIPTQPE